MSDTKAKGNYAESGVDVSAADAWVSRIAGLTGSPAAAELKKRLVTGVGDYACVWALSDDQWIAASCDGVGTKLLWTQEGHGTYKDLAQDLVAMNANDLICVGARPALFLDYVAVGSKDMLRAGGRMEEFLAGLVAACASTGQILAGGETAQMPDVYDENGFELAGFAIGTLKPKERLGIEGIRPGAEVWGWRSNGPHSNGFTWLRKLFDSTKDAAFIRDTLMQPTRLYVNEFLELRSKLAQRGQESALQGCFHITGSGLLNLLRAQPQGRTIGFDLPTWPTLPKWIDEVRRRSGCEERDLWTSMNMGIGFCVVVSPELGEKGQALLKSLSLEPLGSVIDEPVVRVGGLELS